MAEEPDVPRRIAARAYFLLILIGIAFYFGWSIAYGTWDLSRPESIGVYATTILLVGFGVTGYLLYKPPAERPNEP